MTGDIDLLWVTSILLDMVEYPSNGSCRIINDRFGRYVRQETIFNSHNHIILVL